VAVTHVLLTALWGGLMALERRAFLQAMVSRPLVASTVVGLLLEDIGAGLFVGLLFELLHLGGASLGGSHPDHDTLPAVAGAALAAQMGDASGTDSTAAMWSLAVLICLPMGQAGRALEVRLDERARKYFGRAVSAVDAGDLRRAARQNLRAMWPQFLFYGLLCGLAAELGSLIAPLEQTLPLGVLRGLAWAYPAMGTGAAAIAVRGTQARHRFVVAGVAATAAWVVAFGSWYRGQP
jgi:PTS system mannose-specific IIC component